MAYGGVAYGGIDGAVETPLSPSFLVRGFGGDASYNYGVGASDMNTYPQGAQVYLPIDLKVLGLPLGTAPADLQVHLVTEDQAVAVYTLLLGQVQPGVQGVADATQTASFFCVYTAVKAGVVGYTWYAYPGKVPVLEGKFAVSPPLAA